MTSVVNVELAGLGLFFTLGKMTPRFLGIDLCGEEDGVVIGLEVTVLFATTSGVAFGNGNVGSDVIVDDVIVVVGGVSVAKSSVASTNLIEIQKRKNDVWVFCIRHWVRMTQREFVGIVLLFKKLPSMQWTIGKSWKTLPGSPWPVVVARRGFRKCQIPNNR